MPSVPMAATGGSLGNSSSDLEYTRDGHYPSSIRMTHALTWDQLGGTVGTHKITWAQAAPYLTWALTSPADSAAIRATGIKTAFYTDPNRQSPIDPMYTSDETTFAHDCTGRRLYSNAHPDQALMDISSAHLPLLWASWVQYVTTNYGGTFDAIYDDQADQVQYATGTPCNFDWAAWTTASNTMNRALALPIIYNSLGAFSGMGKTLGVGPTIALNATTIGGEAEGCYASSPFNRLHTYEWQAYENTEIKMFQSGKLFLCGGSNTYPAASFTDERIYMYASFLLTYRPRYMLIKEQYQTPSGFHVEPESELLAGFPLVPEPADISGLLQPSGVYGREYAQCYLRGTAIGPCAVVVNSARTGAYKSFPWPTKYTHTLMLQGGGVLDGGTMSLNGPPPPTQINGEEAVIAFP